MLVYTETVYCFNLSLNIFTLGYTYIEVLTLRNSDEQKSLFDAKNRPSIIASILGKLLLSALTKPGSMITINLRIMLKTNKM